MNKSGVFKILVVVIAVVVLANFSVSCTNKSPVTAGDVPSVTPTMTAVNTVTVTPTLSCPVTAGNTGDDDLYDYGPNMVVAIPFTAGGSGTVDTLGVKLSNAVSFRMGFYSDNSGEPGALIEQSAVTSGIAGWNEIAINPAAVSPGTQYWVAAIVSNWGIREFEPKTGIKVTKTYSITFSTVETTGMPSNQAGWGGGTNIDTKMYVKGCF